MFWPPSPSPRADYVSVADPETLEEMALVDSDAMASLAVRIGRTRLIDNVPARLISPEHSSLTAKRACWT